MISMKFDFLKSTDLLVINSILNKPSVNYFFNFKPPLPMSKTKEWYTEVVKNRIEAKGECVVARNNDGVLVGWSYFFQKNDISDDIIGILQKKCDPNKAAYIAATVVDPDSWSKGIGRILIEKDEEWLLAQGIRHVWFGTNSDNTGLKKMHERLGYSIIGKISNYKIRTNGSSINQDIYYKHL